MKKKFWDNLSDFLPLLNKIFTGLLAIYSIGAGIYKGINSPTPSEAYLWIIVGFIGALLILFTFLFLDFGMIVWSRSTNWLSMHIRKHPHLRFWATFPIILFAFYAALLILKDSGLDFSLRLFISLYLIWIMPASVISLAREDLRKERTPLSKIISRETCIQNPQAAIENAFTHFEDRLLKRISIDLSLYGQRLIGKAYNGSQSALLYKSNGKDYTQPLYNLMSGAYSILRNPRHHRIIEDNELKAQTIISFIELLMEFIDASEDRGFDPEIKVS